MGRRGYPAEFRRKVLDLLADGKYGVDLGVESCYLIGAEEALDAHPAVLGDDLQDLLDSGRRVDVAEFGAVGGFHGHAFQNS